MTSVNFVCVREGCRLRVRIVSNGYYTDANCQFPRDIRKEGRKFQAPAECVRFIKTANKYFYSVTPRSKIQIVDEFEDIEFDTKDIKIFENEQLKDCAVCMCNPKESVFMPCGHYYCCQECSNRLKKCPICRQTVMRVVAKSDIL